MGKPTISQKVFVQLMLGSSLVLGMFPPLLMFLFTRKKRMSSFYREASRKALNFHLTIFPFFLIRYLLPSEYGSFIYVVLAVELLFILNAMIRIALNKSYTYPFTIPYIKPDENLNREE